MARVGEGSGLSLTEVLRRYPALAPYISRFAFKASPTSKTGRSIEFYGKGERDSFNPSRPAIELFGTKATARGVAGDIVSHYLARGVDPTLTKFYNDFRHTLTVAQHKQLLEQYAWAKAHEGERRSYQKWARTSGIPAYFRGYAFGQWPDAQRYYTKAQLGRFDEMVRYLAHPAG